MTYNIIKEQIVFLLKNFQIFFLILLPSIIFSYFNNSEIFSFFSLLDLLINYFIAVYIYRLIILKENTNFYSYIRLRKIFKTYIKYAIYSSSLLAIVVIPGYLTYEIYEAISGDNISPELLKYNHLILISFVTFLIITIILLFTIYPFFALILPSIACEKNLTLKEIFIKSKGFKITIFLQALIINLTAVGLVLIIENYSNNKYEVLITIFSETIYDLTYALSVACLSKTFILFEQKNANTE